MNEISQGNWVNFDPKLKELIDLKSRAECEDLALLYSSTYIRQLNDHINEINTLSKKEIETKIDYLAGCLTITLDMPIKGLELLRVRVCEGKKFTNVSDLSYIKHTTDTFPEAGRLNQTGHALFYASIAVKKDDTALRVVLSEANAKKLDHLNVLRSRQKPGKDLYLRIIGIWDYVRRDERPYYIAEEVFGYYKQVRAYMVKMFAPKLLSAYELTDRFFADILARKGSESLYQVTSALSPVFLDGKSDGVLYSSVQASREPVVALTPAAVDSKIEHQFACDVVVEECYGYEFFKYVTKDKSTSIVTQTGEIDWAKV